MNITCESPTAGWTHQPPSWSTPVHSRASASFKSDAVACARSATGSVAGGGTSTNTSPAPSRGCGCVALTRRSAIACPGPAPACDGTHAISASSPCAARVTLAHGAGEAAASRATAAATDSASTVPRAA